MLPHCRLAREKSLREALVHDGHGRSIRSILVPKLAPGQQPYLHRLEETRSRADEERVVALRNGLSGRYRRLAPDRSAQRCVRGQARGHDAGHPTHLVEQHSGKRAATCAEIHQQHATGLKAWINVVQVLERADE